MRNPKYLLILLAVGFVTITAFKQTQTEPWTPEQLIQKKITDLWNP
jgi:hypothetical protein